MSETSPAVSAVIDACTRFSDVTAAYANAFGMSPGDFLAHVEQRFRALNNGETPPTLPPADPAKLEAAATAVQAMLDQMEARPADATYHVIGLA